MAKTLTLVSEHYIKQAPVLNTQFWCFPLPLAKDRLDCISRKDSFGSEYIHVNIIHFLYQPDLELFSNDRCNAGKGVNLFCDIEGLCYFLLYNFITIMFMYLCRYQRAVYCKER